MPEHLDRRRPTEAEAREIGQLEGTLDALARDTSRRGFLARVGGALIAATAGGVVARAIEPADSEARYFGFCGHTFTTKACPHPNGPHAPRIDSKGYPLSPHGHPIDNIGRPVNAQGEPVNDHGDVRTDPDGRPLPPAPRTRVCLDGVRERFGFKTYIDGGWYRCCGGHVRKLVDCCAYSRKRINGDAALAGYCFHGRKVFCTMYFQTKVPC